MQEQMQKPQMLAEIPQPEINQSVVLEQKLEMEPVVHMDQPTLSSYSEGDTVALLPRNTVSRAIDGSNLFKRKSTLHIDFEYIATMHALTY